MKNLLWIFLALLITLPGVGWANERMLEAEITRQIVEALPWDAADVVVDDLDLRGFYAGPVDFDTVVVRLPNGMRKRGNVSASVALMENGREVRRFWTVAKIKVYREAVVALTSLKRNQEITRGDIKLERVELRGITNAATSLEDVLGMMPKRPINPGAVIKMNYLKPKILVRRGDAVVVKIENERFLMKTRATAVENGSRGATIRVRASSGKELRGMVVGPGEISVAF